MAAAQTKFASTVAVEKEKEEEQEECSVVYVDMADDDANIETSAKCSAQQAYQIADGGRQNVRRVETLDEVAAATATRSGIILGVPLRGSTHLMGAKSSVASRCTASTSSGVQQRAAAAVGHVRAMNHEKFSPCRADGSAASAIPYGNVLHGGEHENAIRKCNQKMTPTSCRDDDKSVKSSSAPRAGGITNGNTANTIITREADDYVASAAATSCATNERVREVVLPPPRRRRRQLQQQLRCDDASAAAESQARMATENGVVPDASLPLECLVNDCGYYAWQRIEEDGMANGSSLFGGYSWDLGEMCSVARRRGGDVSQATAPTTHEPFVDGECAVNILAGNMQEYY